ncbi:hypothetical protein [Paratractidigestivibacter sp.]|uniref:hypothetical protein n=1 Tax=Paratractidigestivibacter sp. TaxID=2847316 RepID=UPI002ABD4AB8|nr:hypothetical protein [Paratractidigestivibacter sp.]
MIEKNVFAQRIGSGLMACALATTLGLGLVGCNSASTSTDSGSSTTAQTQQSADTLAAPTDLNIDFKTGKFTFTSNDEGIGYYFLRVYPTSSDDGTDEYLATSKRINGGTGQLSGSVDVSSLGWGQYKFNLVSFASTGSEKSAPEVQSCVYQLGVGGVMEKPEMMVLADGKQAEFYIDCFTLSDWYEQQRMPEVEFNVYSDAACTTLVKSQTVDLTDLAPAAASGPWVTGTNWATDPDALHKYLQPAEGGSSGPMAVTEPAGLTSQLVLDDLDAGTYYVTATAKGTSDGKVSDSKASDVVEFTVTADAPTGEFVATKTSLWADPELGGGGASASAGAQEGRVDSAASQTTTGELVS